MKRLMRRHNAASAMRSFGVRGTTLMEVLVVIVIFLVGILAIAQIFPKGFQILMTTRNNSVSSALARESVEQWKASADQLPDMILPAFYENGAYTVNPDFDPNGTATTGNRLLQDGRLQRDGNTVGPWQLYSGPNAVKRVVGEGRRVPAPRAVGTGAAFYGGLMLLQFGPIDFQDVDGSVSVYANDLVPLYREVDPKDRFLEGEYYVVYPEANQITLRLTSGQTNRLYRVSFSAYVQQGGNYVKKDFIDVDPVLVNANNSEMGMPIRSVTLQSLIPAFTLGSVDINTLKVQRAYVPIPKGAAFSSFDPYEFKLLDTNVGVLLFNPLANSTYINKPGGREPLLARVNYDVYDWRVLKDDFRLGRTEGVQQVKLSVGSLKVAGGVSLDGRPETNIAILESSPSNEIYSDTSEADEARANNLVIVDKETGGVIMERLPTDNRPPEPAANPLITVNKTTGVVTFRDSDNDASTGTNGKLLLPDGTVIDVVLENRALRALYRVRNEFSVQMLKAASKYTSADSVELSFGQYYVGGAKPGRPSDPGSSTRIYFPRMDAGRKVNLGQVSYFSGSNARQINGQDMIIRYQAGDPTGLPSVDIQEVDSSATGFNYSSGTPVRTVKGASVAIRVLWNPDSFFLTSDPLVNIERLNKWGQGYRRSTNETFLEKAGGVQ